MAVQKKKNKFLKYQTNLTLSLERVNLNLRKKGLILNDFKTNKKIIILIKKPSASSLLILI